MALRDNRVFLPRLPQGATEDVLKAHFSRFGDIKDCYIPIDRDTGRPKGLAFITFTSDEEAAAAVAETDHEINNESVEVIKAAPKPDKRGGGGPMRQARDFPDTADPFMAGFLHAQRMMMGMSRGAPMVPPREAPRQDERSRIFVRDVPDDFEDEVLQRYFEQFGEITDLYQPEYKGSEMKKKKGIAYITYKTDQQLSACLAQGERHTVEGVDLVVTRADPRRPNTAAFDAPYRARSPPGRMEFGADSASAKYEGQANRIFAGGISSELSSDDVAEHFRLHGGEVTDVYFPKDARTGSKRGFCYITFKDNVSVHRAVANAPREINGFSIGEVKIAEARPSDGGGGFARGGDRRGAERGERRGDMGRYGYGERGGLEGRGRSSYDGSSVDDGGMGWGGGMGSMMQQMGYAAAADPYGPRAADHWSAAGSGYSMGGYGEGMSREGGDLMERMAPILNLIASQATGGAYSRSNSQAGSPYVAGGGGWGQGGQGGLSGQGSGYGGQTSSAQRNHDSLDFRYRPY